MDKAFILHTQENSALFLMTLSRHHITGQNGLQNWKIYSHQYSGSTVSAEPSPPRCDLPSEPDRLLLCRSSIEQIARKSHSPPARSLLPKLLSNRQDLFDSDRPECEMIRHHSGRDRFLDRRRRSNRPGNSQAEGPCDTTFWRVALRAPADGIAISGKRTEGALNRTGHPEVGAFLCRMQQFSSVSPRCFHERNASADTPLFPA